jgi:Ca2+-binding RTX toxin-like protein
MSTKIRRKRGVVGVAAVEPLDRRVMLAVTASLAGGEFRVVGDDLGNIITISRTVGGTILVNNGAIPIAGGPATVANTIHFHLVGAGGNDTISLDETNGPLPLAALFGGAGDDILVGGSGIDFADGQAGNDTISLGAGDDELQWNPGDGSDVINGQAGNDSLTFNGSAADENFELSDSGKGAPFHRALLHRDAGDVVLDLGGLETLNLNTFGGADTVTINDQTATDIFTVNLDLEGSGGPGGDGQADTVILNGTEGDDLALIQSFGTVIAASASLFPFVNITNSDATLDTLSVNTLDGNDELDASSLVAGQIQLSLNGGAGNDTLRGSTGTDTLLAGDGNDLIDGNGGGDHLTINAGSAALASTQKIAALSINPGGVLDLRDHSLILDYSGASPIGSVTGQIKNGAIASSSDTGVLTAIGVAEASDVAPGGSFAGQSVDATAVLVKFTYGGDANLDGTLNIDDYVRIDGGIAAQRTGWSNGDFNLDGKVNIDDYTIIDGNIANQGPPIGNAMAFASPPGITWGDASQDRKDAQELLDAGSA